MSHKINITTPAAIIIAAVILGASHLGYAVLSEGNSPSAPTSAFKGKAISESDLLTGNTKSKVVVLEYVDTECYYCGQLHPTLKKIEADYASKVAFGTRYFPLTSIHPGAFDEARATYCVGKELGAEKRKNYIDELFTYKLNKQNMFLPEGMRDSIAKTIGVTESTFKSCLTSKESEDAVKTSMEDGVAAGVQGTPATFVLVKTKKGYEVSAMIDGARPDDYIRAAIDAALAR